MRLLGKRLWSAFRRWQLHRGYLARREHYERLVDVAGLSYNEKNSIAAIRNRLKTRGWDSQHRSIGEMHTFAFIPKIGWHSILYKDLSGLGPVTEFDYTTFGFRPEQFWYGNRGGAALRKQMNDHAFAALVEAHARRPVDWCFFYASGLELTPDFLRSITETLGIPTVNMCLDDKQSWSGPRIGDQLTGQVSIAPFFDVSWTSARVACDWYLAEDARPIYMPEGFDASVYRPLNLNPDIPVSFIGDAYGFRPQILRRLRRFGVPVQAFGRGWGTRSVWGEEQNAIFNRSRVNLGMGGIGYSEQLTNVKTRDFEIPGAGGGVYLTSFNPDLSLHFNVSREILCYRTVDECVELIRYYLRHPDEACEIAQRARERCVLEHRWRHRYLRVCQILGIASEVDDQNTLLAPIDTLHAAR